MKKMILFVIILVCSFVNLIYCMDSEMKNPTHGEFAMSILAQQARFDSQLVRKLAETWQQKNPNSTYQDFVQRYEHILPDGIRRSVLPAPLMRAIWQQVRSIRGGKVLTMATSCMSDFINVIENPHDMGGSFRNFRDIGILISYQNPATGVHNSRSCIYRASFFGGESWEFEYEPNLRDFSRHIAELKDEDLAKRRSSWFMWLLNIIKTIEPGKGIFGQIFVIPESHSFGMYQEQISELIQNAHYAQKSGLLAVIFFVQECTSKRNINIILEYQGLTVIVPSIEIPTSSSPAEVLQTTREAIAAAIDNQSGTLYTIQDALDYIPELNK